MKRRFRLTIFPLFVFSLSHRRQIEQLQTQLEEAETRYKTDLSRMKTKFQNEIEEIRVRYESLRKIKVELENQLKKLQAALKDAQDRLIEEQNVHEATRELLNAAEKRNGSSFSFIEKFRFSSFCFSLQQFFVAKSKKFEFFLIA